MSHQPTIEFFRLTNVGRPPERADRAAGGTLPTRAFRYCEASTTAAALGWYIFPPISFRVLWTGTEVYWTYLGAPNWYPLGVAQFPGFRSRFDEAAPAAVQGYSPTFLAALPEAGTLQIWSGLIARSKPGWSLLARPIANMPRSAGYEVFEGVIEADQWFGPLFINVRLTRTRHVIEFDVNSPIFQVQPIERRAYSEATLNDVRIASFEDLNTGDWAAYEATVVEPSRLGCPRGANAVNVRKRRRAEVATTAARPAEAQI